MKEGPKSEVLRAKGQSVIISVVSGKYYYIGLKTYTSGGTTVSINGVPVTYTIKDKDGNETYYDGIYHATDLYYEATPESGDTITITNTGNGILSITKLRTTGAGNTVSGAKSVPADELLQTFRSIMSKAATQEYTGEVLTEEEAFAEEPVEEAEEEVTETVLDESDIIIENTEEEPVEEPASEPAEEAAPESTLAKLLSSFFNFFRRRP